MYDENDEKIDVANKAKMIFKIKSEKKLEAKDMLIKSKEAKANE